MSQPMDDVTLQKLVDKVYKLLMADVRLGQARGEALPRRALGRGPRG